MKLEILKKDFAVCKSKSLDGINFTDEFVFIGKTDEELSVVCEESSIPKDCTEVEIGWKAFRIVGTLEFSLVGILAKISSVLAEKGISIFALSTFNTDYILIKSNDFGKAIDALKTENYQIV